MTWRLFGILALGALAMGAGLGAGMGVLTPEEGQTFRLESASNHAYIVRHQGPLSPP